MAVNSLINGFSSEDDILLSDVCGIEFILFKISNILKELFSIYNSNVASFCSI